MYSGTSGPVPSKRDIAVSIVLSLITCGIYDLIWDYHIGHEIREQRSSWQPRRRGLGWCCARSGDSPSFPVPAAA